MPTSPTNNPAPSHNNQQRQILRQQLRQQRRELCDKSQQLHAAGLYRQLQQKRFYQQARHIAFYLAADGEISLHKAIQAAWRQDKKVYLPVLSPFSKTLFFAPYTKNTKMKHNRFGILEPAVALRHCKRAHQLQLICMPLVGFDNAGNRLGMGGGFYDRSLAFRQHQKHWHQPKLFGCAHELQKMPTVPTESWDISIDAILTEQQTYRPKKAR